MKNTMVRTFALLIIVSIIISLCSIEALAGGWVVAREKSYIHSKCSSSEETRVGTLHAGERLEYLGETKTFDASNTPFPWYKVRYNGSSCWISGKYTDLVYSDSGYDNDHGAVSGYNSRELFPYLCGSERALENAFGFSFGEDCRYGGDDARATCWNSADYNFIAYTCYGSVVKLIVEEPVSSGRNSAYSIAGVKYGMNRKEAIMAATEYINAVDGRYFNMSESGNTVSVSFLTANNWDANIDIVLDGGRVAIVTAWVI